MGVKHDDLPWDTVEADFGFGAVTIYYRDMNLWEEEAVFKARDKSIFQFIIEHLWLRARDETGARIWRTKEDREKIAREFDAKEVKRVVNLMCEARDPGN